MRLQYADMKTHLPDQVLAQVDHTGMVYSIEVRAPYLDHELAACAATLPQSAKLRRDWGKRAFEDGLPRDLLYRPKMGFGVTAAEWLQAAQRRGLRQAVVAGAWAQSRDFDRAVFVQLLNQHQAGTRDHSATLWQFIMFDAFLTLPDPVPFSGCKVTLPMLASVP